MQQIQVQNQQLQKLIEPPEIQDQVTNGKKQKSNQISTHCRQYQQYFESLSCKKSTEQSFAEQGIFYDQTADASFSYKITEYSKNKEVVKLFVKFATFSMYLTIFNSPRNNPLYKISTELSGNFGTVYIFNFNEHKIAIKVYSLAKIKVQDLSKAIAQAIYQYCITKISSVLKCGPFVPMCYGFDLVIYENSIEFCLQACQNHNVLTNLDHEELKKCLYLLHSYKIMHLDIKPANIMYSKHFRKVVFIDYGFSQVVSENQGQLSWIGFKGTPQFTCSQMRALFIVSPASAYIDLYFNDLYGLKKTLSLYQAYKSQESQVTLSLYEQQQIAFQYEKIVEGYMFIYLQYCLYYNRLESASLLKQNKKLVKSFARQLLKFITQLPFTKFLQQIVSKQLKQFEHLQQYRVYRELYKRNSQKFVIKDQNTQNQQSQLSSTFDIRFTSRVSFELKIDNSGLIQKYLKNREYYKKLTDKTVYYSLLLEAIRFDKPNFSIQSKISLAKSFLIIVGQCKDEDQVQQSLGLVKRTFKYLLGYCLLEPLSDWKNQNRSVCLIQCFLLDANVLQQINILHSHVKSKTYNQDGIIQILIETFTVLNLHRLKISYQDNTISEVLRNKLQQINDQIQSEIQTVVAQNIANQQQVCHQVKKLHEFFPEMNLEANTVQFYLLKHPNNRVKAHTIKELMSNCLQAVKSKRSSKQQFTMVNRVKTAIDQLHCLRYNNLMENAFWNYYFLNIAQRYIQLDLYCSSLRNKINCDAVYDRFIFKINHINTFQLARKSNPILVDYFKELVKVCFDQGKYQQYHNQIYYFVYHFIHNKKLYQQNIQFCVDVFKKLILKIDQHQLNSKTIKQHQDAQFQRKYEMSLARIYFFDLLLIMGKSASQLLDFLWQKSKKNYWEELQHQALNQQANFLSVFQFMIMSAKKYRNQNRFEQAMDTLLRLLRKLSPQLIISCYKKLLHSILKVRRDILESSRLISADNQKIFQQILVGLWKHYLESGYLMGYFVQINDYQFTIADTLQTFWTHSIIYEDFFSIFLEQMIVAISSTSYSPQIKCFIANLNDFYLKHRTSFDYQFLTRYTMPVRFQNRFYIFLYALSLQNQQSSQAKLVMRKKIVSYIDNLNMQLKYIVLRLYFQNLVIDIMRDHWINRHLLYIKLRHQIKYEAELFFVNFHLKVAMKQLKLSAKRAKKKVFIMHLRRKMKKINVLYLQKDN